MSCKQSLQPHWAGQCDLGAPLKELKLALPSLLRGVPKEQQGDLGVHVLRSALATNANGRRSSRTFSPPSSLTCPPNTAARLPLALPVVGCQLLTCVEMTAACHGLHERPHWQR